MSITFDAARVRREDARAPRKSRRRRRGAGLALCFAASGCLQGPWEYVPENPEPYRGLFVTGYLVADLPMQEICFERLLALDEESTQAFPFYDSASVEVSGPFGGETRTVALDAIPFRPNCFAGPPEALPERGGRYALGARLAWDSAGRSVTSTVRAEARVPSRLRVRRMAEAPAQALRGSSAAALLDPAFWAGLTGEDRAALAAEFGPDFLDLEEDSAAVREYLEQNGARFLGRILEIRGRRTAPYSENDTVYYLAGESSLLSHYFAADRSDDVGGVLITQRYGEHLGLAGNAFTDLFGEPDTADFFLPGNIRSLAFYQDATGPEGWNLLDRMAVVNAWLFIGHNRFYFYALEPAYASYLLTTVQGDEDSRILPRYNTETGKGIFAGAVKDSFDLYVRADSATKVYPLDKATEAFCRKEGWYEHLYCRSRYQDYCRGRGWEGGECAVSAIFTCMQVGWRADTLGGLCQDHGRQAAEEDAARRDAERLFCTEADFPAREPACEALREECLLSRGRTACKEVLWDYCALYRWRPEQCASGLVSYCFDRDVNSPVMCREAKAICAENPEEPQCP